MVITKKVPSAWALHRLHQLSFSVPEEVQVRAVDGSMVADAKSPLGLYVLDFSRKEVVDCIYGMMAKILEEAKVSYIKWDMNRSITECYSRALPADRQGEVFHRYILGVYDLYERLTSRFPQVLFESCASGGLTRGFSTMPPRAGPATIPTRWSVSKSSTAPPTAIRSAV